MTTNFYAPPSAIRGSRVLLPEEEAHHARSVLRVQAGDELNVVDGEGGWYRLRVTSLQSSGKLVGSILERRRGVGEPDVRVTVGMGLLKKRDRFETFAEKAVELGVHRIVPLRTAHAEPDTLRRERVRNVMVAALKQCRRSWLPPLAPPQSLGTLLGKMEADHRFLCHGPSARNRLRSALRKRDGARSTLVLVGPEGGFHEREVEQALESGCVAVSLGPRRLRAETAGIVAVTAAVQGERAGDAGE